ncbi:MAG TPA: protein-glutamate O-methyltransferase CheR [Candidatus Sulfotelmatobacter sp.]|nr:protein-glutamate O-methyltransferase CheR [Candidatus Sulfotelmatobacter sp.]HWI55780.1 protein-glutamate O-methyltransferase CheR [Bacillota bacterium]
MESAGHELSHVCFVGAEPLQPDWRLRPGHRKSLQSSAARAGHGTRLTGADASQTAPPNPLLVWLFQAARLDAGAYRPQALQRRLLACLRVLRVASPEAARALLEQKPELLPQALSAVLIGVSEFFRDPNVFEQLRQSVLPELLQGRRGLRVYSAGCSAGQELYSMALLLAELGVLSTSCLLGIDCRPKAIAQAQAGWFPATDLTGVSPKFRQRYFQLTGVRTRVAPALRRQVCWRVGNLLTDSPPGTDWDVVLCRNVAIYLQPDQTGLWARLADQLRPGGVLVTGKAERPPAGLPLSRIFPCIYQRTSN